LGEAADLPDVIEAIDINRINHVLSISHDPAQQIRAP